MSLHDFVEAQFGRQNKDKLGSIRRGGDNNSKGNSFETYFAAAKVCEIAATQADLDDHIIAQQELAFVDDLCVKHISLSHKENYQVKNSSGDAASWDAEMQSRFEMQTKIDLEYHKFNSTKQTLLVSCQTKKAANEDKIPEALKAYCASEFFPYNPSSTKTLYASEQLKEHLRSICSDSNLSTIDTAYRVVISALMCEGGARSVGDVIGKAKADSRPNVFRSSIQERPGIPNWLHEACNTFPDLQACVEFGNFRVSYNGFEVSVSCTIDEPTLGSVNSVSDVMNFLMDQAQKDL